MKAPNLPSLQAEPAVSQAGQTRGSRPSAGAGKKCGPSIVVERVDHLA